MHPALPQAQSSAPAKPFSKQEKTANDPKNKQCDWTGADRPVAYRHRLCRLPCSAV